MTVMDKFEFRDTKGPAPLPKSGVMRSNKVRWAISPQESEKDGEPRNQVPEEGFESAEA